MGDEFKNMLLEFIEWVTNENAMNIMGKEVKTELIDEFLEKYRYKVNETHRQVRYDNPSVMAGAQAGIHRFDIPERIELESMTTDDLVRLRKDIIYVKGFAESDINTLTRIITDRVKI